MHLILFTFLTLFSVNSLGEKIAGVHPFFVSRDKFTTRVTSLTKQKVWVKKGD